MEEEIKPPDASSSQVDSMLVDEDDEERDTASAGEEVMDDPPLETSLPDPSSSPIPLSEQQTPIILSLPRGTDCPAAASSPSSSSDSISSTPAPPEEGVMTLPDVPPFQSSLSGKPLSSIRRGPGRPKKDQEGRGAPRPRKKPLGLKLKRWRSGVYVRGASRSIRGRRKDRSRDPSFDGSESPMRPDDKSDMDVPVVGDKVSASEDLPLFQEQWPGKQCALCNLGERSQLGQGDLMRLTCPEGFYAQKLSERIERSPRSMTPLFESDIEKESFGDKSPRSGAVNFRRQKHLPKAKRLSHNGCPEPVEELSVVGYVEEPDINVLFESTGHFYVHESCALWSSGVVRSEDLEFQNVAHVVQQSSLQRCSHCGHLGASISCKVPGCSRIYHFPCAAASGAFQDMKSIILVCTQHLDQVRVLCNGETVCVQCYALGNVSNLMMCTSCGRHYHGNCLPLALSPAVRAGWQCSDCRMCQVCRQPDDDTRLLLCEVCDKAYHSYCIRPAVATVPKQGWKCMNCRVCSDCGARRPGLGHSSRWHAHFTVCDSCYQQRNKGLACPLCGRSYRAAAQREMVQCGLCRKHVHGQCDSEADLATYQHRKESNPDYEYVCPNCKSLTEVGRQLLIKKRESMEEASVESSLLTTSQESLLMADDSLSSMEVEQSTSDRYDDSPVKAVGLGKGKPFCASKIAKKKLGLASSNRPKSLGKGGPGKVGFQKKQKIQDFARRRAHKPKMRGIFGVPGLGLQRPQADFSSSKSEEEPGVENRLVLCSSKDKFVLHQDICVMCGALGNDQEGCLISCSQCGQCYHPYCVNVKVTKVILQKGWRCLDCTVCEGCGQRNDEARLILCDDCDISYHIYCMDPPLDYVPHGNWKCKWCTMCQVCGSNDPGFNSNWQNNYSECGPCASLSICPACNEPYIEGELIIQCVQCERWIHGLCDRIRTEVEAERCAEEGYTCVLCRPRDVLPPHLLPPPPPPKQPPTPTKSPEPPKFNSQAQFLLDGVVLSEMGMHQIKALTIEQPRKKRKKVSTSADTEAGIMATIEYVVAGESADNSLEHGDSSKGELDAVEEPHEVYKEGMVVTPKEDGRPPEPPEGFTIVLNEAGVMVLRKKRQRNLQRLGVGGFAVRLRTSRYREKGDEVEVQVAGGSGGSGETAPTEIKEEKPRRKPQRRKPKNKLMETFPSYIQEAFFGRDLLDISKEKDTRSCSDSEDETASLEPVSEDKTIQLSQDELKAMEEIKAKREKEAEKEESKRKISESESTSVRSPKGSVKDEDDENDAEELKDILPLEEFLDNELVNTIMNEDDMTKAEENLEDMADSTIADGSELNDSLSMNESGQDVTGGSQKDELSDILSSPAFNLDSMVGETGLQPGAVLQRPQVAGPLPSVTPQNLPSPMSFPPPSPYHSEYSNSPQFSPAFSEPPSPWHPQPDQEGETSTSYNSRNLQKMEADEALGANATISQILYANLNHPDLKKDYPNFPDRARQIGKIWRTLPQEKKAPYYQKARENRSAVRIQKSQQDQDRIIQQQKSCREAEQERQWKQLQAMRQQQAQQQQQVIHEQRVQVAMARVHRQVSGDGAGQFSPEQPPLPLTAQLQVSTVQDPNSTSLSSPSPSARQAFPSSIHVNRVHAPQSPVTSYPQSRQELPARPTAIQLPRQGRGPDQFPRLAFPQPQQPQPCQDPYSPQTPQTPHPAHPSPQESSPQMHEQFPPSAGAPNQVETYAQQSPTALSRSRSSDMDPYSQSPQTPRPQSSDRFGHSPLQSPNPISRSQSVESFSKPSPTSRQHLSDMFQQAAPPKPRPSTPADHYVQASVVQRPQPPFSQSIVTARTQIPTSLYSQASSSPRSTPSQDIFNTLPSPQRPSSSQDMYIQPATPHPQQPQESYAPQTPAPQPPTPPADTGPPTQPGPEVERQQLRDLLQRQEFKKIEQDRVLQTQPTAAVRHWNPQQPPQGHDERQPVSSAEAVHPALQQIQQSVGPSATFRQPLPPSQRPRAPIPASVVVRGQVEYRHPMQNIDARLQNLDPRMRLLLQQRVASSQLAAHVGAALSSRLTSPRNPMDPYDHLVQQRQKMTLTTDVAASQGSIAPNATVLAQRLIRPQAHDIAHSSAGIIVPTQVVGTVQATSQITQASVQRIVPVSQPGHPTQVVVQAQNLPSQGAAPSNVTEQQEIPESVTAELEKLEQDGGMEGVPAELGDLGVDDDELLGMGNDFNILEYADPELDNVTGGEKTNILDNLDLEDDKVDENKEEHKGVKREVQQKVRPEKPKEQSAASHPQQVEQRGVPHPPAVNQPPQPQLVRQGIPQPQPQPRIQQVEGDPQQHQQQQVKSQQPPPPQGGIRPMGRLVSPNGPGGNVNVTFAASYQPGSVHLEPGVARPLRIIPGHVQVVQQRQQIRLGTPIIPGAPREGPQVAGGTAQVLHGPAVANRLGQSLGGPPPPPYPGPPPPYPGPCQQSPLQEQPLLLEDLLEQEKREQEKQQQQQQHPVAQGPPCGEQTLLSDVDFERLKADVMSSSSSRSSPAGLSPTGLPAQGILPHPAAGPVRHLFQPRLSPQPAKLPVLEWQPGPPVEPKVGTVIRMPAPHHTPAPPASGQVDSSTSAVSQIAPFTANLLPAPPAPPEHIVTEQDRQQHLQYEQWLRHQQQAVTDQLKHFEAAVNKLRKAKKSLNSKQRQLRKNGQELAEPDALELDRISREQSVLQKHLDQARKQSRQHSMTIQDYNNKQQKRQAMIGTPPQAVGGVIHAQHSPLGPPASAPSPIHPSTPQSPMMSPSPSLGPCPSPMLQHSPLHSPLAHSPGAVLQHSPNPAMSPHSLQPSPRMGTPHSQGEDSPFSPGSSQDVLRSLPSPQGCPPRLTSPQGHVTRMPSPQGALRMATPQGLVRQTQGSAVSYADHRVAQQFGDQIVRIHGMTQRFVRSPMGPDSGLRPRIPPQNIAVSSHPMYSQQSTAIRSGVLYSSPMGSPQSAQAMMMQSGSSPMRRPSGNGSVASPASDRPLSAENPRTPLTPHTPYTPQTMHGDSNQSGSDQPQPPGGAGGQGEGNPGGGGGGNPNNPVLPFVPYFGRRFFKLGLRGGGPMWMVGFGESSSNTNGTKKVLPCDSSNSNVNNSGNNNGNGNNAASSGDSKATDSNEEVMNLSTSGSGDKAAETMTSDDQPSESSVVQLSADSSTVCDSQHPTSSSSGERISVLHPSENAVDTSRVTEHMPHIFKIEKKDTAGTDTDNRDDTVQCSGTATISVSNTSSVTVSDNSPGSLHIISSSMESEGSPQSPSTSDAPPDNLLDDSHSQREEVCPSHTPQSPVPDTSVREGDVRAKEQEKDSSTPVTTSSTVSSAKTESHSSIITRSEDGVTPRSVVLTSFSVPVACTSLTPSILETLVPHTIQLTTPATQLPPSSVHQANIGIPGATRASSSYPTFPHFPVTRYSTQQVPAVTHIGGEYGIPVTSNLSVKPRTSVPPSTLVADAISAARLPYPPAATTAALLGQPPITLPLTASTMATAATRVLSAATAIVATTTLVGPPRMSVPIHTQLPVHTQSLASTSDSLNVSVRPSLTLLSSLPHVQPTHVGRPVVSSTMVTIGTRMSVGEIPSTGVGLTPIPRVSQVGIPVCAGSFPANINHVTVYRSTRSPITSTPTTGVAPLIASSPSPIRSPKTSTPSPGQSPQTTPFPARSPVSTPLNSSVISRVPTPTIHMIQQLSPQTQSPVSSRVTSPEKTPCVSSMQSFVSNESVVKQETSEVVVKKEPMESSQECTSPSIPHSGALLSPIPVSSKETVVFKKEQEDRNSSCKYSVASNVLKIEESQNVLLKQLLQNTGCASQQGSAPSSSHASASSTTSSLRAVPSLEAQLARPVPPTPSSLLPPILSEGPSPKSASSRPQSRDTVPSPSLRPGEQSPVMTSPLQPEKKVPSRTSSQEEPPTPSPVTSVEGESPIKRELPSSGAMQFPIEIKKEPEDIQQIFDEKKEPKIEPKEELDSGLDTSDKLSHEMMSAADLKKLKRRQYQQKRRQSQGKEGGAPKKRSRKGSKVEEDHDSFIDNLINQLRQLPMMNVLEPELGFNFSVCPFFGAGDLSKLGTWNYSTRRGELEGNYGSAQLPFVADHYNTQPFGELPPLPPPPPVSQQRGFYDQEFAALKLDNESDEKKQDLGSQGSSTRERDVETPDSIISSSSPECVFPELIRFPGLQLIEDSEEEEERRERIDRRASPVIPIIAPIPIRLRPYTHPKDNSEVDKENIGVTKDPLTLKTRFGLSPPAPLRDSGNVTVTLTLTSVAAEDILGVLRNLANILHIPAPSGYHIVERTTTPPSQKLGLYRTKGKDGKEGAPIDIQSILNGAAKFCRHCDVVILNNLIKKKASELPFLSKEDLENGDDLYFCSPTCYMQFALTHRSSASEDKAATIVDHLYGPVHQQKCKTPDKDRESERTDSEDSIGKDRLKEIKKEPEEVNVEEKETVLTGHIKQENIKQEDVARVPEKRSRKHTGDNSSEQPPSKAWKGLKYKRWSPFVIQTARKYKKPTDKEMTETLFRMGITVTPAKIPDDTRKCMFCHQIGDGVADGTARLLNFDVDKWVHLNCALWSDEVYETVNGALMNLENALQQSLVLNCVLCHQVGATVRCFKVRCSNVYHLSCAVKDRCVFYKNKTTYCVQHVPKNDKDNELTTLAVFRRVYVNRDENRQVATVMHQADQRNLMRVGSLIFLSVGQLLPHQLQAFHTSQYIYPIGYKIVRFYWSMRRPNKRCRYICSIHEVDAHPEFRIVVQEHTFEDLELRDASARGVWLKILEEVAKIRKETGGVQLFPQFVTGEDLFGLTEPAVVRVLESLPGIDSLSDYRYKYGRNPLLELPLAVNPTGCARSEPKLRTHFKRPHTQRTGSYSRPVFVPAATIGEATGPYCKQFVHSKSSQYKKMKMEWRNNVFLARSKIQGLGLYAARDIERHTMVIEYIGELIRTELAELREKQYEARNRGIYMFRLDEERVVDATLSGGLARYINHSCNPNCVAEIVEVERDLRIIIFAKRRISRGEELAYDYKFDIEDDQHKIPCLCGAPNCRKWMN